MYSGRLLAIRIINMLVKWLGRAYERDKLAYEIKKKKKK